MFDHDAYWLRLPRGVHPTQYQIGTFVRLEGGKVVRIIAQSTKFLKVRPPHWWERIWHSLWKTNRPHKKR